MRRTPRIIQFLALFTSLTLLPFSAFAADPQQNDIRWVSSTPLDDLPAAYLAESAGHGFDAWIAPDGVRARAVDGAWQVGLTLLAVGRHGAMKEAPPAGVEAHGNRAELHRGSLTEWYLNDERGLEQGFTLKERPAGDEGDELVLELELTGDLLPLVAGNGLRVDLLRPGNPLPVVSYSGLAVVDSEGSELPARLELGAGTNRGSRELRIVVADADAVYPLTVDPLLTTAVWSSSDTDNTRSVAWGDWDGDGDLDLAAGNAGYANRVYENDGLGQPSSLISVWTSADTDGTSSLVWGDWDGDGDLDLAAGNNGESNRVYENDGLGLANSLTSIWTSADTDQTLDAAWGDWDGDGDLDLAAGNFGGSNRVYENDGLGQPGSLTQVWTSADTSNTYSVAWGDWDGDGDLDLAAGNNGANRVYGNDGLGQPGSLALVWTSSDTDGTSCVAWGDWDGDGDLDLAAGNNVADRVYENDGLGLANSLTSIWTSAYIDHTTSVAWGDWDGDGDLDLAAGSYSNYDANRVYGNDGLGQPGSLTSVWASPVSDHTFGVAWGDWDGDGDLDLVAGNTGGEPNRLYSNTGGALTTAWTSSDLDGTLSVAWGDWDGDGDLDLAAGSQDGANRVYSNDGLGQPGSLTLVWTTAQANRTASIAWGDWDGDGDLDLAAGNIYGSANRVYGNTGGDLTLVWTSSEADDTRSVAWGDWDGDGDLDLAVGNEGDPNRVYENDGLGLPNSLVSVWVSGVTEGTLSVAWGDWDGDGDLDLAAGNHSDPNRVYENDGLGQPGSLTSVWTSSEADDTGSVAWGDWDADGDLDLAAGNEGGNNRIYENDGLGQPSSLVSVDTFGGFDDTRSLAWGDWDGDGDLDLAAGNDGVNRVYENDGLGQWNSLAQVWASSDTDWTYGLAWGDWDGDGDLDLAAGYNGSANRVYENGWLQRPGGLSETPVSPILNDRPGSTDAAFFFSAPECLASPVTVDYILTDEESDPALSIIPEYSLVGEAGWHPATEGPGGSGTTNLPADADGWDHSFVWDCHADSVGWSHDIRFRITVPHQASTHVAGPILRGAMSAVSPPFRICDIPADISVTKDDGVTQVLLGQFLTYTITVSHNAGLADANAVRVIDLFPAGLSGVYWSCLEDGGGSCSAGSGIGDIDTFVDLPVGTYVTFLATGTVTAAGASGVTNTVEVLASAVAPDPYLANNTATDVDQGWGGIFADGFESGDTSAWSAVVP